MAVKECDTGELSPIVFYYADFSGTGSFCTQLEKRFRQDGHARKVVFKEWNCYKELPGTDGDLFLYDGVVLPALADKGFLRPVPDTAFTGDVFEWVIDKSRFRRKSFGLPVMLCSNALICREEDDRNTGNIMDLQEKTAIPVRSMIMFYFIQTVCSNKSMRKSLKVLEHLLELIGGRDFLAESRLADYDGISRFNREECRYFLGFTESMQYFNKDSYTVRFADFSAEGTDEKTLFMADFVSIGKNVRREKLQDCLDLVKIMTDEQFIYDLCVPGGRMTYLLPANRSVFLRLAGQDPVYKQMYSLVSSGENGILRFGKRFYEVFYTQADILLQFLWEKAGWKP